MLLIDSTALDAVLEEVRVATAADDGDAFTFENLSAVLQDIRAAMKADRMMAGPEDLELANAVEKMLPEITARISEQHEELRAHLQADASWALTPLDMELDLLGPLAKANHEPTHTRVLSYLLNPSGAHGLGVRVAREFFVLIGKMIPGEDVFERLSVDTPGNTELLRQIDVRAEQTVSTTEGEFRCDVWLELSDHERTVVVVVENKVGAAEHGEQLRAYEDAVWEYARRRRKLNFDAKLIYLSPDGRAPTAEYNQQLWLCVSYLELAATLARAGRDAPEPGRTFLNLYTSTILRLMGIPSRPEGIERLRQLPYLRQFRATPGEQL
jgi:PD-(D/E)XK nuclease superfamily